jgi:hypothetical protein
MTALQRLVSYQHSAVFDKSPGGELLFRLGHPDGATWTVADAVMIARAGEVTFAHNLSALTVAGLAAALQGNGFTVSGLSSAMASLSALVVIEGDGDEGISNGSQVLGYTSLLWVLMGGYAAMVREAGAQVLQALRQMVITQAEDEWLDLWGTLYSVMRKQGESDAHYQPRIPKEAFRLRLSPIAIEEAIKDATGKTVRIEEPWQNVFRLDGSLLSGSDSLQDGVRVGAFLIQPVATMPIDWTDVLPVIERNRAAGIVVLGPVLRVTSGVDAGIDGSAVIAYRPRRTQEAVYEDKVLLDYAEIEEVGVPNEEMLYRTGVKYTSSASADGWLENVWANTPWPDSAFSMESYHYANHITYFSGANYESIWPDVPWLAGAWSDFYVFVGGSHSSS